MFACLLYNHTSTVIQHFITSLFGRLSSIDTKYHIWKLGVVLTDNVSSFNVC